MKLRKINKRGFSHVELAIVVLVVAVLGLVGYRVLKNTSHAGSEISQSVSTITGLTLVKTSPTQIFITWDPSMTPGVSYEVLRNGLVIGKTDQTVFSDENVTPSTSYKYSVITVLGNQISNASDILIASTKSSEYSPISQLPIPGQMVQDPTQTIQPRSTIVTNSTPTYYDQIWSGYLAASSSKFNNITAEAVVPKAACQKAGSDASFWVGFDGGTNYYPNSVTVEQDGFSIDCIPDSRGKLQLTYWSWVEMYPNYAIAVPISVKPGDKVLMAVNYTSDNKYHFTLKNETTGKKLSDNSYTCPAKARCLRQGAEVIVEEANTSYSEKLLGFTQFLPTTFTNIYAATDGHKASPLGSYTNQPLYMVGTNYPKLLIGKAAPKPLSVGAISFVSQWLNTD